MEMIDVLRKYKWGSGRKKTKKKKKMMMMVVAVICIMMLEADPGLVSSAQDMGDGHGEQVRYCT